MADLKEMPRALANGHTHYPREALKYSPSKQSSLNSVDSSSINSNSLMPIDVKSMLLHGVNTNEVIRNWLISINCQEYLNNFIDNGYDMSLLTRMTPQDLTAIGCKSPAIRKKLLLEIKKLNLDDDIPNCKPNSLKQWLELLKMGGYLEKLCSEGYNTIDKVCELTWEDLEDIGINKLGHQKRLLLGIERVKKFDKQQEELQNDYGIYDVHPNHRVSLNQTSFESNRLSTMGRSTGRAGFFQTRSGANLDHRGLPIATIMPALKHVNSSLTNYDTSFQAKFGAGDNLKLTANLTTTLTNRNIRSTNNEHDNHQISLFNNSNPTTTTTLKMSDLTLTMKRAPPPLPPVRTNSLKYPQDTAGRSFADTSIYGNNHIITNASESLYTPTTTSTSFLRTPKLGTLTATTNKMLTSGGHIQTVTNQPGAIRTIMPIREAPPIPTLPPPITEKVGDNAMRQQNFRPGFEDVKSLNIVNPSLIAHQLASADEFPPPPPPQ